MRDARLLMAFALGIDVGRLTLVAHDPLPEDRRKFFMDLVEERERRRPVSQLVGGRWFRGRWFTVTGHTLDPRPDTELLVDLALEEPFTRVLDLGTGTGAIVVTLLAERAGAIGVGTDISAEAVLIAGENATRHGVADRLVLPLSEWWDDVGGSYDLIVSNPPYIAAEEMDELQPEVRDWEPRIALTDESDGLTAYREIAKGALDHLRDGGRLIVEIGHTQADAVSKLFIAAGLRDVRISKDLDGRDRCVQARAIFS